MPQLNDELTEDDFDKKYTYDESVKSGQFDTPGQLETYGEDYAIVEKIHAENPYRVWTMLDGDDGMYLCAGWRFVNRVYYVITTEEWNSFEEEYLFDAYEEEE